MDDKVYAFTENDEEDAKILADRSDNRTTVHNVFTEDFGSNNLIGGA